MASSTPKLKVFFLPYFGTGHMLPFLDLAFLFAGRPNIDPTLLTTPANAPILQPTIDTYASASGGDRTIKLLLFPFPSAESGLPPGQENASSIPYGDIQKLSSAADLSRGPITSLFRLHRPEAVIFDICFLWMPSLAAEFGIPSVAFHVIGVFPQRIMDALHKARLHDTDDNMDEVLAIPDLPGEKQITMPRLELPLFVRMQTNFTDKWTRLKAANKECFGVVVNTFYEMEPEFCEEYRRMACRKAWFVGPVALAVSNAGGSKAAEDGSRQCLRWLDAKPEGSVVYVCFGSWCNFTQQQLTQIAIGLEKSGKGFLWVVRGTNDGEVTGEEWIPDGWEQRVRGRGLMVRGWAPQTAILGHKAIGGFMTQCGWNAVLESVATAGVPLLTWPLVFEQFMNERLMVEVLEAGVRVCDGLRRTRDAEERVVVPGEVIGRAVSRFIDKERGAARTRAKELEELAHAAVAEGGGSWNDLNCLMDELITAANEVKIRNEEENAGIIMNTEVGIIG